MGCDNSTTNIYKLFELILGNKKHLITWVSAVKGFMKGLGLTSSSIPVSIYLTHIHHQPTHIFITSHTHMHHQPHTYTSPAQTHIHHQPKHIYITSPHTYTSPAHTHASPAHHQPHTYTSPAHNDSDIRGI